MGSFSVKDLRFTFKLSNNAQFASASGGQLQLNGLRAYVTARGSGMPAFPECDIAVYGMREPDMDALATLAFSLPGATNAPLERNTVKVEASVPGGWATVFYGQIISGGPDYSAIPAVPLRVFCRILGYEALNPVSPSSYQGSTPVSLIAQDMATQIGYTLENNGVSSVLVNSYFTGTIPDQLRALRDHADIDMYAVPEQNIIAICPKGVPRQTPAPFTLTKDTGLVGHPMPDYNRGYIRVRSLYNAAFHFGGKITVAGSTVKMANGSWMIGTVTHILESQTDTGAWFSDMLLYPPGLIPPTS